MGPAEFAAVSRGSGAGCTAGAAAAVRESTRCRHAFTEFSCAAISGRYSRKPVDVELVKRTGRPAAAGPYTGAAASNPYLGFSAEAGQPDPTRPRLQLDDWQRARAFIAWMYGPPSVREAQPMRYGTAAADAPRPGVPTTGIDDAVDRPAPFNQPPVSSPPQPPLSAAPPRPQSTYWSLMSPSGELLPVTNPVYQQPRAGADAAFVRGDVMPGDTRPPPNAADVRAAINANRLSPGAVPKPGQTLPPAFSPGEAQSQLNRMTGALLRGLVPESFKPDSDEDVAEWNRRMSWYMQHPEHAGKMNLPWLKSEHPGEAMLLGALDGLTWGVPAEAAAAKAAPLVKAAARAIMGGMERSAARGALRAGAEQVTPELAAQAERLVHPGAPASIGDAPAPRGAPGNQLIAGGPGEPHVAYATHEFVPGDATGHLPGLQAASDTEKAAYSRDPRASWAIAPGNRDPFTSMPAS